MNQQYIEHNKRILVIDDNQAIHEDFRKILKSTGPQSNDFADLESELFGETDVRPMGPGFELDSASQGQEGLDKILTALQTGRPYAMAFIDVRMPPGWDGVETTARIWKEYPDLQVVICTAYSDYSWEDMIARIGQSDRLVILKKPFDNVEVVQLAHALTEKWRLLQESRAKLEDLERLVEERTAELIQAENEFRTIFEKSPEGIFQLSQAGTFFNVNPAFALIFGFESVEDLVVHTNGDRSVLFPEASKFQSLMERLDEEGAVWNFEMEIQRSDGSKKWVATSASNIKDNHGNLACYQGFVIDISEQKRAEIERSSMEIQLRHAQKMESIGELASGIAHEINTPTQYVGDNIQFLKSAFADLAPLMRDFSDWLNTVEQGPLPAERVRAIKSKLEKADWPFLEKEIPQCINQTLEGVDRIASIVGAMKKFAHPGTEEKSPVNLNQAIENTIIVARNEWKYVAEVVKDLDLDLPLVPCLAGEFNQVILNLITNATHAIADVAAKNANQKGTITITTKRSGDWAEIYVTDTGAGIHEKIREKIFDPFFTTKPVGQGTGQGLAICHSVIVHKHHGTISVDSEVGVGTTFRIRLPILGRQNLTHAAAA